MKKKELLFIAAILVLALVLWRAIPQILHSEHASVHITVDGQDYGTFSLSEDRVIPIGTTNVCEIKDGTARMIEAHCPDQLCMHQQPITAKTGGLIVCLPNKVILEGVSAEESSPVDAVS